MEDYRYLIELAAIIIESLGVLIIAIGSIFYIVRFLFYYLLKHKTKSFVELRRELGKAILLGLEILIAADIIATVSATPSMDRVLILGLIVLIRTFLSFALEVEMDGKFPWQKAGNKELA
jgi:uncharacterized membrane protein